VLTPAAAGSGVPAVQPLTSCALYEEELESDAFERGLRQRCATTSVHHSSSTSSPRVVDLVTAATSTSGASPQPPMCLVQRYVPDKGLNGNSAAAADAADSKGLVGEYLGLQVLLRAGRPASAAAAAPLPTYAQLTAKPSLATGSVLLNVSQCAGTESLFDTSISNSSSSISTSSSNTNSPAAGKSSANGSPRLSGPAAAVAAKAGTAIGSSSNSSGISSSVSTSSSSSSRVLHIIFLQHGFQGSAFDMRLLKNHLRLLAPGAVIVTAESNQEHPNASLREMGENLAHEVRRVVHAKCPSLAAKPGAVQLSGVLPVTCKLSFAGHSAGAVIIRCVCMHYYCQYYCYYLA
jgi:Putative serine esterase (DUF676)